MVGIVSYGGYVPVYRLARETIGKAWEMPFGPGERSVANEDEDSMSMAVEAGLDCLKGIDPKKIDGLYFATTTSPYKEKQCATIIATALDLRTDIMTADFTDSLRSATIALRSAYEAVESGSAQTILVIASDCRIAEPESAFEQMFGDGAAALLVGKDKVAAEIKEVFSVAEEFLGTWRRDDDLYPRQFDSKVETNYGYMKSIREAVSGLMSKSKIEAKDISKAIIYSLDPRALMSLAGKMGFDLGTQLQDPLFMSVGNTGTALVPMMIVAALEDAKPGEKFLVANYGDGSDAFLIEITGEIKEIKNKRGMKVNISNKRLLPNYERYVKYRQLMPKDRYNPESSPIIYWRSRKQVLPLYGHKCKNCSLIQYPMMRVCFGCGSKDNWEEVSLSKNGKIFTYTLDHLRGGEYLIKPVPKLVVELDGGGRVLMEMTDCDPEEVRIDLPVELTFRKVHEGGEFHNYYWKCRPIREGGE